MEPRVCARQIHYELQDLIGAGASGCVYRGFMTDPLGTMRFPVAIKILDSETRVEQWRSEFESLVKVASDYCVRVFGFDRIQGKPALVLEFVDGVTLFDFFRLSGDVSSLLLDEILSQIYRGLSDLDRVGLHHGDLSPSNVMLSTKGQVKLLDFGLANTEGHFARATTEFASPKRVMGEAADLESDLYSLGAISEWIRKEFGFQPSQKWLRLTQKKNEHQGLLCPVNLESKQALAQKVLKLKQQIDSCPKTQKLERIEARVGTPWGLGRAVAKGLFLLATIFGGRWPHGQMTAANLAAAISVRSNKGVEIFLNERSLGYAPFDLYYLEPGHYRVRWQSAQGQGSRALTLKPREHIVLDDRIFR